MAQYEFCAQAEPGEPPTDLVTYRILPDDSIEQIDAQPAVGLSTRVILVDPRANWVYTPHSNELGTLFQLQPDGTVASKEALEGKFYENSHTGLRPDGEGFIGSETFSFSQNIFLRYYEVTNDCEITPAAASLDLLTNGGGLFGFGLGISQVGNFTILGQNREFYRVYHMDPDGTIHPPTPDVQWGTRDEYDSRTIDVSRDGRLMISYGAGDLFDAVSM
jgi:hypothetical protein